MMSSLAAAEHSDLGDDEHQARRRWVDLYAVKVDRAGAGVVSVGCRHPGLPTVPAGHQAAHLHRAVNVVGIARVHRDSDYALDDFPGMHSDVGEDYVGGVHRLPGVPGVHRAADDAAVIPAEHYAWVMRMGRQRPNVSPGRVLSFPTFSPVVASVNPIVGPGENDLSGLGG